MGKRYLVVLDPNSGIAELSNVAIVVAGSPQEAKEKFIENTNFGESIKRKLTVKEIREVTDYWMYYW